MTLSFAAERASGSCKWCKSCSRRWSIRAITLASVAISSFVRMVHMVDPEGQVGIYTTNNFAVGMLLRFPQLFILIAIVLVMLLWRRLLRSRQTLKKMNNKLSWTTKGALYMMAVLFSVGSVSVAIDFGEQGNSIAAWLTWCCAVAFLFVLMVVVFHYTGQVVKTLTLALRTSNSTLALKKVAEPGPDEALCFSNAGLLYCCPNAAAPQQRQPRNPMPRTFHKGIAPHSPTGRKRRVSLSRITQASSIMSRSNVQRVRSAVLWTACLWGIGLIILAPAFVVDSMLVISRDNRGLNFEEDASAFVVYFLAFRVAEVLALAGILRAQWLGAPEDIHLFCFHSYNKDEAFQSDKHPLRSLLLQLFPWVIWVAICAKKAQLPENTIPREKETVSKSRNNHSRGKLSSSLSAQRQALAVAVARSNSISPTSTHVEAADSKGTRKASYISPAATYVNSLKMTQLIRRHTQIQGAGQPNSTIPFPKLTP